MPEESATDIARRERDRQWVTRLRGGDERALAEIFDTYYLPLCRYAETMVHSSDVAFDVTSDVFRTLWTKRDQLDPADLRVYLLAAVRNRIRSAERHRRVEEAAAELMMAAWTPAVPHPDVPGADESLIADEDSRERAALIDRAYAALSPRTRAVLDEWAKGQSYREIGRTLGIAIKTVDAHLQQAKRTFRQIFGRTS